MVSCLRSSALSVRPSAHLDLKILVGEAIVFANDMSERERVVPCAAFAGTHALPSQCCPGTHHMAPDQPSMPGNGWGWSDGNSKNNGKGWGET
eukprot:3937095-Rhodomonas_salina.2